MKDALETAAKRVTNPSGKPIEPSVKGGVTSNPSSCTYGYNVSYVESYLILSGEKGVAKTCDFTYSITKGTATVRIESTALSASLYKDTWSYSLTGLSGFTNAAGIVPSEGTGVRTLQNIQCIDVSKLTQTQAVSFSGKLTVTSVGDDGSGSGVVMLIREDACTPSLKIISAQFDGKSVSPKATLISPVQTGTESKNLAGEYISVPIKEAKTNWGLPLTVSYEPANRTITRVRVGYKVGSTVAMVNEDVKAQITKTEPGKLTFSQLKLPQYVGTPFAGKVGVVIELTASDAAGVSTTTSPEGGLISFKTSAAATVDSYTPLFLASETITAAARRYGLHTEAGGDNWAQKPVIDWLSPKSYRFDDISGLHVQQYAIAVQSKKIAIGDSTLGHKGHSDGTQIDLRYADGVGGFSDTLGGANGGAGILIMLNSARLEMALGPLAAKPQIRKTIAWIMANRAMIESTAPSARVIYFGDGWLQDALEYGQLPGGVDIFGISNLPSNLTNSAGPGEWKSKPLVARRIGGHLNHWHLSLATTVLQ